MRPHPQVTVECHADPARHWHQLEVLAPEDQAPVVVLDRASDHQRLTRQQLDLASHNQLQSLRTSQLSEGVVHRLRRVADVSRSA